MEIRKGRRDDAFTPAADAGEIGRFVHGVAQTGQQAIEAVAESGAHTASSKTTSAGARRLADRTLSPRIFAAHDLGGFMRGL